MRHRAPILAALTVAALLLGACSAGEPEQAVTIGLFKITSAGVADEAVNGFKEGFLHATGLPEGRVRFTEQNAQGDPSLIQSIARQFADSDADMIAVIGTPAVIAQAELVVDRPIIALAMGDPVGAGLASSLDAPGGNVIGSVDYVDPAEVVDEIRKVHPELARIGTVYDASNQNSQVWIADLRSATGERGMTLEESTIATSADLETATRALVGRVDAILVGPDATVVGGLPAVGQVAATQHLPLYATAADVTTAGLVATLGPDYAALGRMAGDAAAEVYTGKAPGEVAFRRPGELVWELNPATVAQLGIDIPDDLLERAGAAG